MESRLDNSNFGPIEYMHACVILGVTRPFQRRAKGMFPFCGNIPFFAQHVSVAQLSATTKIH
jgi:hypothetical protein